MALNCGIVGLPNVGKSTIFSALTSAKAEAANYPFCTIEPNVGIVNVPDPRLEQIVAFIKPKNIVPAATEFVDIAGLVKGASKGEGLGNKFLGHIRQVGAIIHVVRCFEGDEVIHVSGKVDPVDDIETIHYELALADLETIQKRKQGLGKLLRSQDKKVSEKAKVLQPLLDVMIEHLSDGKAARLMTFDDEQEEAIKDLHLITMKKQLYLCNVDEDSLDGNNELVAKVKQIAKEDGSEVVAICGQIEAEIASLESEEDRKEFLESMEMKESGLSSLIRSAYNMLGLQTFFTAGEKEVRAWTFKKGSKAPQTAGVIHSDFERGFIKAEIYHCNDLFELKSEKSIRENGKYRIEGKDYIVKDGDVILFRFNV